ncbi:DUF4942 domain-containing protein [Serratia fonticola]|uniref:DUF4942 domain-containing protein n=1 Tax=Serratia fonticola TaxID=47917 RepID=A0AAJ1YCV9_SERFO|nr:DUF4942 domain-containing protein [Serratia fonticola]MDQ9127452.1 DUF4942 domain-containing protein [Serratia fonticola]
MSHSLSTVTETPEVLTGHTELICSTDIERLVTGREVALKQIEAVMVQLQEIGSLISSIGGGKLEDWAVQSGHRYGCHLTLEQDKGLAAITRQIDRKLWQDLMNRSGMLSLMDAQARDQWYKSLESKDVPAISEESIYSTFEQLHHDKGEVFERGVINVFKALSWDYKTNNPCCFGKKIIVSNLVSYNQWGFTLNHSYRRDQLADLERVLHLLDGKPLPDSRGDITTRLYEHICANRLAAKDYHDDYLSIRYFMKGSAHIVFRKPELIDRMNEIIAKHYPGILASR